VHSFPYLSCGLNIAQVAEHSTFFYEQMAAFIQAVAKQWTLFENESFKVAKSNVF
jgi:hypothetical protein